MAGQQTIAQTIRAQFPGDYDDLTDQELEAMALAKQPEKYGRLPRTPAPTQAPAGRDTTGDVPFLPDWVNDAGKGWVAAGPSRVKEGIGEIVSGEFARGGHDVLMGGLTTAAPMVAPTYARALASAPTATLAATAAGGAGAVAGSVTAESLAEYLGATEDQAALAGDMGGLGGGYAGVRASQAAQQVVADLSGRYGPAVKRIASRALTLPSNIPTWAKRAAVDRAMRAAGVPGPLASRAAGMVIAEPAAVQGRGGGAGPVRGSAPSPASVPEPASAPAVAVPASPPPAPVSGARTAAAASPETPTPQVKTLPGETLTLPPSARTAGQMSPASIRMDLGLSARRLGLTLSPEDYAAATELVTTRGLSPAQAVASVTPSAPVAATQKPRPQLRATQDEAKEFARLMAAGKTESEAVEAIVAQRKLIAKTGATSPAKARRRVATRQATGRWPDGTP